MGGGNGLGDFSRVIIDYVVIRAEFDQPCADIGALDYLRAGINCHAYVDFLDHPLSQCLDGLVIAEMIGSIESAAVEARAGNNVDLRALGSQFKQFWSPFLANSLGIDHGPAVGCIKKA